MTDVEWVFNHPGPYVDDVANEARNDDVCEVTGTTNFYGDPKEVIKLVKSREYPSLTNEDKQILDSIIETTNRQSWNEFIRLIYSTYPVMTQDRFSPLNLAALARGYADDQAFLKTESSGAKRLRYSRLLRAKSRFYPRLVHRLDQHAKVVAQDLAKRLVDLPHVALTT
jgi:hypothetical protein